MGEENKHSVEVAPKKKKILILIIVGVVIVCSILYIVYRSKQPQMLNQPTIIQTEKTILLSEVSAHDNKESCWTIINDNVYDVTKFISIHKGGDRILAACGIDGTDLFTGKSPMGRIHSQMAVKLLGGMKIGTLQQQ